MTKIEKVARELFADRYPDDNFDTLLELERGDWFGHARAALEAMKGPTEKMELEADRLYFRKGPVPIADVFNTMIQSAIDEKE